MSEVRPALTPQQWAEFLAEPMGSDIDDAERGTRRNRLRRIMADDALNARRYGAAAALALHGEPFGFAWDDVSLLVNAARHHPDPAARREMAALAERVAALLPPRGPSPG